MSLTFNSRKVRTSIICSAIFQDNVVCFIVGAVKHIHRLEKIKNGDISKLVSAIEDQGGVGNVEGGRQICFSSQNGASEREKGGSVRR